MPDSCLTVGRYSGGCCVPGGRGGVRRAMSISWTRSWLRLDCSYVFRRRPPSPQGVVVAHSCTFVRPSVKSSMSERRFQSLHSQHYQDHVPQFLRDNSSGSRSSLSLFEWPMSTLLAPICTSKRMQQGLGDLGSSEFSTGFPCRRAQKKSQPVHVLLFAGGI